MRLPFALASVLAFTAAAPASAECLDASDLARGVEVTFGNGDRTTLRRLADGGVEMEERRADGGPALRLRSGHGIYVFEEVRLDAAGEPVPDTRLEVVFAQDTLTLPPPAPGVSWSGRTTNRFADGTERAEIATVAFAEGAPLEVEGCAYRAIAAEVRYDWGKAGGLTLRYDYLPALGAAVIRSSQPDGGERRDAVPAGLALASKAGRSPGGGP